MELKIEYRIEEITRYKLTRRYYHDGRLLEVDLGHSFGQFESRADAERIRDALEADVRRKIAESL